LVAYRADAAKPTPRSEEFTVPGTGSDQEIGASAPTVGRKTYYCPRDAADKLKPIDERLGELKLQLDSVRRELRDKLRRLRQLDKLYPGRSAPAQIADEYNGLVRSGRRLAARERSLVRTYNGAVDECNDVLKADCG